MNGGELRILPGCPQHLPVPHAVAEHLALAEQAQAALERRQQAYPPLVIGGKMTEADAQADIAAWQALAAEWRWIATGRGALPPCHTLFDRIEAVDRAIDRVATALARAAHDEELQRQQALYLAMRWHLSRLRWGDPAIHFLASITHQLRARCAVCPTCERHRDDPRVAACTRLDCTLPLPVSDHGQPERTAA